MENKKIKINVIETGSVKVSAAIPDKSAKRWKYAYTGLFQGNKSRITVPVKCFLIEMNNKKILIDAGWSEECLTHPIRHLTFPLWFSSIPVITEKETLKNQLKEKNIKIEEIDYVLMTHLDVDHVSGLRDVKQAGKFYVSPEESDEKNINTIRYNKNFWKGINFDYYQWTSDKEAPFGKSMDFFGDGSIIIYYTPTHSTGLTLIKIVNGENFILITGDNAYNRKSWEEERLPGVIYNEENARHILKWIKEQSKNENCKAILTSHDGEEKNTIFNL